MKTMNLVSADRKKTVLLKDYVAKMIDRYHFAIQDNHSAVSNYVRDDLRLAMDETDSAVVITGLIKILVTHSRYGQITISAKELYGKMAEFSIRDENCVNTYGVALSLQDVVPLAEKAGGRLNILNRKRNITTVTFIFPLAEEPADELI